MDTELVRRIADCKQDYKEQKGREFDHFHCPILDVDEKAEMCKGHVVPKKLRESNIWVPQRADIDNFYGTVVESMFISVVQDRGKDPFEVWTNPKLNRRHRPRIERNGQPIDHYFSVPKNLVDGHTPVQLTTSSGYAVCDLTVKMSAEQLKALDGCKIQLVIERDYRAPVIASLIKAAHLTLFKMLGYRYVFSPSGGYLAHILATFYRENFHASVTEESVESFFRPLSGMVLPMITPNPATLTGTVKDNQVLGCMAASGRLYALGVIVRASAKDVFCVFVPTDDGIASHTYQGFVKEPPSSIGVKLLQYCPGDEEDSPYWRIDKDEPTRIKVPNHFSPPEYSVSSSPNRKLMFD